jgi:hypothetical protein
MVLLRGTSLPPLAWDGEEDAFKPIPDADPNGSYTKSIPPAEIGAVMVQRLLLVQDRDTIAVSDILDFTRYDDALSVFRINQGEDDPITAIFPFRRNNLLVFKRNSVHLLGNVTGDLSEVTAEVVNGDLGCVARRSVAAVGGDVYFLAADGIYRISEVVEQSMQVQEIPISEPVESLIRRINFNAAAEITAVVHGRYYRLAVPLDGATRNNAVLVYDTTTGMWQGYDEYPDGFRPDLFVKAKHDGKKRAIAIDLDRATVAVLDIGAHDIYPVMPSGWDFVGSGPLPLVQRETDITSSLTTRGYILLDDGPKRIRHGTVTLETWNPRFTISTVTEGVNEEAVVMADRTRDRTKWHIHGKADYDTTNANHDHAAPKRRDYSVILPADGIELDTGIRLQLGQESIEQFPIRQLGRWLALKITNTQGRIAIKAAGVDGQNIRNSSRIFA